MTKKIQKSESEWQKKLTDEQFQICRKKGTERAFSGKYWDCHDRGTYHCCCCDEPLFSSKTKFDSGTGWPSFYQSTDPNAVTTKEDSSFLCVGLKFYAANAIRTSVMYLKTGQNPLAFAIASIPFLWNSKNLKQFKIRDIELKVGECNPLVENLPVS